LIKNPETRKAVIEAAYKASKAALDAGAS